MDALRNLSGWYLLGAFPDPKADDVGSWLLHNNGEAMLWEVPPGLTADDVAAGLKSVGAGLRYVTASHLDDDHLDIDGWNDLQEAFHGTHFMRPTEARVGSDLLINLGGEPLWLVKAPKHSPTDTIAVFRGVAMTGDLEFNTLDSVKEEVPRATKATSMDFLRGFEIRTGYRVHTIVSAHLNDFRPGVNWSSLFEVKE